MFDPAERLGDRPVTAVRQAIGAPRQPAGAWRRFDATDGLPAGVWCLAADQRGFLWIGTRSGLCRYDGTGFETFSHADGLAGNEVMAVLEHQGVLWIGTRTGLSWYEEGRFRSLTTADGLPNDEIEDLCFDGRGTLWVATHRGVAGLRDGGMTVLSEADGLLSDDVRRVFVDREDQLWIGTKGGLSCYREGWRAHYTTDDGLPASHILAINQDAAGRLLVGTLVGAAVLDGGEFQPLGPAGATDLVNVRSIVEDHRGRLWLGTIGQGLYCHAGDQWTSFGIRDGLIGEHVAALMEDSEGHLWIGDGLSGLTCFHTETIEPLTDEPVTEDLRLDADGRLWFANGNLLCCLADGELRQRRFGARLFGLLIDPQGRLWVATWGDGLYRFEHPLDAFGEAEVVFTTADGLGSNNIAGLTLDHAGRVWAGCGYPGCACRFDGQRFEAIETPLKVVFRLLEDRRHRFWLAGFSAGGLACLEGERLRVYGVEDGLPTDAVQSLCEDDRGELWIGTRQGVCRYDGETFAYLGKQHGFLTLDNQVSVLGADGHVWLGTKCGVYRWSGQHLQVLTDEDGLPGNAVTSLVPCPDGSMIVGTFHGIVRYRPTSTRPPLIEVREVIADRIFEAPEEVELTAGGAGLVTFHFRGLSLGTHRMRYSYCLEGHDRRWTDTWETQVRYENLPVGEYTFRVQAVNRDLVESMAPAEVRLRVVVDPWREQQAEYEAELTRMQQRLELQERAGRQNRALVELAQSREIARGDLAAAARTVARAAAATLEADRVAVWRLAPGGAIKMEVYDRHSERYDPGPDLTAAACPGYRHALEESRSLAIDDAQRDGRTAELRADYLDPGQVVSLLASPVRVGGRTVGVLSAEQTGHPRRWRVDEAQFAASVADLLSLAVESQERQEAEARVRYQAHLLEQVNDAVVAVDVQHRITSWNAAAARMYGWPATEAVGRDIAEVVVLADEALTWDFVWAAVAGDGEWRGEVTHRRRDGEEVWVDWSLSAITAADGQPGGTVAVIHDVTERKRAEDEQRRLEMQIQHAQKLESLGVMAGGIAHDFNNLLMGVLGNAGLALVQLPMESPARASVEQIELAAQRAADLTRQMLAYSGKGQFEIRPVDLNSLVREMAHLLEVSISKKAVLNYDFEPGLPAIEGDATQIRQVVMNLITNASDALHDSEGVIHVSTGRCALERETLLAPFAEADLPDLEYLYVEVADTGSGMDEETLNRVFEPFFTTKFTGRGLGLAAALGIVRGHRGAISVDSMLGRGTTFRVLFPPSRKATGAAAAKATAELELGTGTILVVDDEETVLDVVERSLTQFGYQVLTAGDGQEGVEVFRAHAERIALVVLDMTMPRMDGVEACRAMRAERAEVPVLLSSGYSEQEALGRFRDTGVSGFLQKPYGPLELVEKIREVLGR